jgi:predicted amidohydrolase
MGCTRATPEGAYNAALIFDRAGTLVGTYDKTHLQTHDHKYLPGKKLSVFESDFGPFGVMICADRRWPETVRTLALGGARVIFNPTCGMHDERNLRMMQTRSYESEVFIAFTHPGQSLITDPRGTILRNEEAEGETFAVTDIDLAQVDRVRSGRSAHLRDRRPELYM